MTPSSPRRPKAIVFDLGKVLLHFDFAIAARAIAPLTRVEPEGVRIAIDQSPLLHQLESGRIDFNRFIDEARSVTGYTGDNATFRRAFADIFEPIPAMIEFHASLHDAGIPTFILSNTNEVAVEFITARYPFFQTFKGHVFSHEVGCMKPAPAIYEAVERLAGFSGADLFFIDDRPENVEAAWARGWQGIVHADPAITIRECTSRLAG
jgi:HAD superfamily hydrolase (TIGR01509 family)